MMMTRVLLGIIATVFIIATVRNFTERAIDRVEQPDGIICYVAQRSGSISCLR